MDKCLTITNKFLTCVELVSADIIYQVSSRQFVPERRTKHEVEKILDVNGLVSDRILISNSSTTTHQLQLTPTSYLLCTPILVNVKVALLGTC